jgi:hypothetical protein
MILIGKDYISFQLLNCGASFKTYKIIAINLSTDIPKYHNNHSILKFPLPESSFNNLMRSISMKVEE